MTYVRGNAPEFDTWQRLGNPSWNWSSLFPCFHRTERYTPPSETQLAAGAMFQPQHHGLTGPIHVGYIKGRASRLKRCQA